jgi:transcriptional regulator with XRE-family HTH domain
MTIEDQVQFGNRVRQIRTLLNLLQKDFAKAIEISKSFLSEIEAGRTKAGYDFFFNIVRVFNVNPVYLLRGEGEMFLTTGAEEKKKKGIDYTGPDNEIVSRMLGDIAKVPVIRFAVLEFYEKYVFENREMVSASSSKKKTKKTCH